MPVNKVILIGNVGRDPEVRYLDNNTPVASFSLATTEVYKNKNGEKVKNTEWHNIVLWRGLAQVAEKYVKKGNMLYIEGKIRTRSWDDKDGNKRYTTEIVGDNMQMLSKKDDGGGENTQSPTHLDEPAKYSNNEVSTFDNDNVNVSNDDVDDLPF